MYQGGSIARTHCEPDFGRTRSQPPLFIPTVSFGKTKFESQTQTEYLATAIQGGRFLACLSLKGVIHQQILLIESHILDIRGSLRPCIGALIWQTILHARTDRIRVLSSSLDV